MHESRLASVYRCLVSVSAPLLSSFQSNSSPRLRKVSFSSSSGQLPHSCIRLFSLSQDCSDPSDLGKGRQVHARTILCGFGDVGSLQNRILGMYVLCGRFTDAKNLFFRIERAVSLPWNWLIKAFTLMGQFELAVLMYFKMWSGGVVPDKYTFPLVIKACCGLAAVEMGRDIHETIRMLGLETDLCIGSSLIKMYVEGGLIFDAREVFDKIPRRDCILWNVMIDGYAKNNYAKEAINLFHTMRYSNSKLNDVTFVSIFSICASQGMLKYGIQLHGLALRCGVDNETPVANTLLSMYSKCQCWFDMYKLFDSMGEVDLVTWNGIISGYVQNGLIEEALDSFYGMQAFNVKPDSITCTCILPAFTNSRGLVQGKEIQAYVVRNIITMDVFLKSALIDLYFKCRDVEMARRVFNGSDTMDTIIVSAMISGYVLNGMNYDALEMFRLLLKNRMKPNSVTIASLLPACSGLINLRLGKELHNFALKHAFIDRCYVGSAVLDMYAKCARLDSAYCLFIRMPEKDSVAWNSMISSFVLNAEPVDAIDIFKKMGLQGIKYDCVSITSALSACSSIPALHYGKEIHGFMVRTALSSGIYIESALIDMYAKCGQLVCARRVFDNMQSKNEVSWNSIIAAYGVHGRVKDMVILFDGMKESGFYPDHVTFLSMISACGHAGRVEEGLQFFKSMRDDYKLLPRTEHYASMVDLFGRAGRLDDALYFIKDMLIEPETSIWGAVLGACRVHRNAEIAELATKHLFELDPQNSGYYILMSNVQAVTGKWEGVLQVRSLMKERRIYKSPGYSWVDINGTNHLFIASDKGHPETANIYLSLSLLLFELKEEGYIPQPEFTCPRYMVSS